MYSSLKKKKKELTCLSLSRLTTFISSLTYESQFGQEGSAQQLFLRCFQRGLSTCAMATWNDICPICSFQIYLRFHNRYLCQSIQRGHRPLLPKIVSSTLGEGMTEYWQHSAIDTFGKFRSQDMNYDRAIHAIKTLSSSSLFSVYERTTRKTQFPRGFGGCHGW